MQLCLLHANGGRSDAGDGHYFDLDFSSRDVRDDLVRPDLRGLVRLHYRASPEEYPESAGRFDEGERIERLTRLSVFSLQLVERW